MFCQIGSDGVKGQILTQLMTNHHPPTEEMAAVITTVISLLRLLLLTVGLSDATPPPTPIHVWMDSVNCALILFSLEHI